MLPRSALPRRRFLSGIGASALAVGLGSGLAGCGDNTGRPPAASTSASGSDGPKPALAQWYHEYGEDGVEAAVKRYAAAYEQASVSVRWNPGDYDKLASASLLTANVPDVFEYANGPTLDMIRAGQVLDLTDVLGDAAAQFSKPVLAATSWEGHVWAIPQTVDMQMLFYRKSVLEKAGVAPPTTLAELITAAKAVTTKDMGGFFAGNDGGVATLAQMLVWSAGQEQLNADSTGIGFDNADGYAAFAAYRELATSGGLVRSASADWFDPAPLNNGETAMQWTGLWTLPVVQAKLGDDFGVLPFPAIGTNGRQSVPFGAYASCVAAKGKDPQAAAAFVRWLWVDQEADQVDFSNSYGTHIPAKPALVPQATKLATGPGAEAAKFVDELGHAPSKLWTSATSNALVSALTRVVTKNADPRSEIGQVASTAKTEIARAKG
ncbi:MAG TPA: extracellular solute-binding protein [Friedmanniella sp.]